ncbi:MAG TPA: hypothetical protein VGC29_04965 [Flavisolibacter sp.]
MKKDQLKENRNTAPDPSGGKPGSNVPGKNPKEEAAEGSIRKVQSEDSKDAYGDDYESGREEEISNEEARTEKEGRTGKS